MRSSSANALRGIPTMAGNEQRFYFVINCTAEVPPIPSVGLKTPWARSARRLLAGDVLAVSRVLDRRAEDRRTRWAKYKCYDDLRNTTTSMSAGR